MTENPSQNTGSGIDLRRDTPKMIHSGEWRQNPQMADYRAEWLSELLVERSTWRVDASPLRLNSSTDIAGPEFVWFRFWLPDPDQIVEKYFDAEGRAVGMYLPVCEPLVRQGREYHTRNLILGLWLSPEGHLNVLREDEFETAIETGLLSAEQAERAEARIRELTTEIFQEELPPALVRNFELNSGKK